MPLRTLVLSASIVDCEQSCNVMLRKTLKILYGKSFITVDRRKLDLRATNAVLCFATYMSDEIPVKGALEDIFYTSHF
jgi:hypothetical protein